MKNIFHLCCLPVIRSIEDFMKSEQNKHVLFIFSPYFGGCCLSDQGLKEMKHSFTGGREGSLLVEQ